MGKKILLTRHEEETMSGARPRKEALVFWATLDSGVIIITVHSYSEGWYKYMIVESKHDVNRSAKEAP